MRWQCVLVICQVSFNVFAIPTYWLQYENLGLDNGISVHLHCLISHDFKYFKTMYDIRQENSLVRLQFVRTDILTFFFQISNSFNLVFGNKFLQCCSREIVCFTNCCNLWNLWMWTCSNWKNLCSYYCIALANFKLQKCDPLTSATAMVLKRNCLDPIVGSGRFVLAICETQLLGWGKFVLAICEICGCNLASNWEGWASVARSITCT